MPIGRKAPGGGSGPHSEWQLTLRGPGATSVRNQSRCLLQEIVRMGSGDNRGTPVQITIPTLAFDVE